MDDYRICLICSENDMFIDDRFILPHPSLARFPKFKFHGEFSDHMKEYHRNYEPPHICPHCKDDENLFSADWAGHINMALCFMAERKSDYDEHMLEVHNIVNGKESVDDLICECCDYETNNPYLMKQHKETKKHKDKANGVQKEHYHCESCDFTTPYKSKYEVHCATKSHTDKLEGIEKQTEWYCECCDYRTSLKHHYEKHLKTKTHNNKVNGVENYKCNHCDYETEVKHHYQQHLKTKSHIDKVEGNEKERIIYHCEECDYETAIKCNYERHCLKHK